MAVVLASCQLSITVKRVSACFSRGPWPRGNDPPGANVLCGGLLRDSSCFKASTFNDDKARNLLSISIWYGYSAITL